MAVYFSRLQQAFAYEYVTNDHLVAIASYLNNEIRPTIHMPMADEIAEKIKETRAANLRSQLDMHGNAVIPEATASDVQIVGYYGNYNDLYAVMLVDIYHEYTEALWSETIDGVTFNYKDGNSILVWREGAALFPPLKITDFPGLSDLPKNPSTIVFGTNSATKDEATGLYGEPLEYNVPNEKISEVINGLLTITYYALAENINIDLSLVIRYLRIYDETNKSWSVDLGIRRHNERWYEPLNIQPFIALLYETSGA